MSMNNTEGGGGGGGDTYPVLTNSAFLQISPGIDIKEARSFFSDKSKKTVIMYKLS